MSERESMEFDVVIVGAGVAGLSAAIKIKQLDPELSVVIVEKGAEIGAHILSGAVIEPKALDELIPDWKEKGAPLNVAAQDDNFMFLSKNSSLPLPTPPQMKNHGNYIISLGNLCRWLGEYAASCGVEIFPGFAASEILYDNDQVIGIATGDMGISRSGEKKDSYQRGVALLGKYTLFAEGCRGSLAEDLMDKYNLRESSSPQTYGIGIKELWEVPEEVHKEGSITHTIGWPLDSKTYGGSFIYHLDNNQIAVGFVVGLDYENPYLSPYEEFQRFKTHPKICHLFENSKRISYGARALNEGGFQSIPKLIFPGGAIIGCSAGFLNVPKIKGSHTAMKSAMLAAESIVSSIKHPNKDESNDSKLLYSYPKSLRKSWIYSELKKVRNIRPSFNKGLYFGLYYSALTTLLCGKEPWTFKHHKDNESLKEASKCKKIDYPKHDGKITFDRLTSVQLSGTNHEEDQAIHLTLKDENIPVDVNLAKYDGPEQRFCPAGVYEYIDGRLQINAQNCVHCKTCDIKDPKQNIKWVCPEGGGGPRYPNM